MPSRVPSSASKPQYGRRLIPHIIDQIAREDPERVFAAYPRSKNLADGFINVSYRSFANAINRASWWLFDTMGHADTPETFAYFGPNDLRFPIFVVAAIKCEYKAFLPSPRNSLEHQHILMDKIGCKTVFSARESLSKVQSILDDASDIYCSVAPELEELLNDTAAADYEYDLTFEESSDAEFLILHTSGSTGPPKPVTFTIACTTTEDAHQRLPDPSHRLWWRLFANSRYFLGMPCFHSAGLWFSLFIPVYYNSTVVFGPGNKPLTATIADETHQYGDVSGGFYPPSVLEEIHRSDAALGRLGKLKFITYGGGTLSAAVGRDLAHRTTLHNFIGYTEASAPPRYVLDPEDWDYLEFHPASGMTAESYDNDLYKVVFRRLKECSDIQSVFRLFPDLEEYAPGDLVSRHPTKENLWIHRGRIDDLITLSTGEKLNPVPTELVISRCPFVSAALVVGDGRFQASLLVELDLPLVAKKSSTEVLEELWSFVEDANKQSSTHAKILKPFIMFANKKHFIRSPKGLVQRKATVQAFQSEIELIYSGESSLPNVSQMIQQSNGLHNGSYSGLGRPGSAHTSSSDSEAISQRTRIPSFQTWPTNPALMTAGDLVSSMDLDGINIRIRQALAEVCHFTGISDDNDFFDMGMDSLLATELVNKLQSVLPTNYWPKSFKEGQDLLYSNSNLRALADVISQEAAMATINGHVGGIDSVATTRTRKEERASVDDLIEKYSLGLTVENIARRLTVVLTGSTGTLGSHILDRLIQNPSVSKIVCLNRAVDGLKAQSIANSKYGLQQVRTGRHIKFLQVDLSDDSLGLKPYEYSMLLQEADIIIHCAWELDFLRGVQSFEQSHIAGVRRLVYLAAHTPKSARIMFMSSIASVMNWNSEDGNVPEEIIIDPKVSSGDGYGQAKHVAERILHLASAAGVKVSIVRIGQIAGPSTGNGLWNKSDWLPMLLHTSKSLRMLPKSLGIADSVDWIPVDILADIIMDLMQQDLKTINTCQVYHTVNPNPIPWAVLLPSLYNHMGGDMKLATYDQWIAALRSQANLEADLEKFPALKLLGWFTGLIAMGSRTAMPQLSTEQTKKASPTLAGIRSVNGVWMENWLHTWGI